MKETKQIEKLLTNTTHAHHCSPIPERRKGWTKMKLELANSGRKNGMKLRERFKTFLKILIRKDFL